MAETTQAVAQKNEIDEAMIKEYIDVSGLSAELSENEQRRFIQFCVTYQLNPIKGEVHCSAYGEGEYRTMNLIVGFLTYVKRAELSGRLDGWSADIEGSGDDAEAVVTIWRKDWSHEFRHRVHWKEAVQHKRDGSLTAFWKKMPRYLLKKTAIAQAFRLAFPAELAGMGYDEAEFPEEMLASPDTASDAAEPPVESPANPQPKSSKKTPRKRADSSRTDSQTIPFPSTSPEQHNGSTPNSGTDERAELENAIRRLLLANALALPKAHVTWIEKELAKKPPKDRLEQIIEHMRSVIGDDTDVAAADEDAASPADTAEELIY